MVATHNILKELSNRGHEITVCSTYLGNSPMKEKASDRISFAYHRAWVEGLFFSPSLAIDLAKLKISDFDIVHVVNCRNFPSNIGLLRSIITGRRIVFSANGTLLAYRHVPHGGFTRTVGNVIQDGFLKSVVSKVTAALAVSNEEKLHYKAFGINSEKITVVGNGIDTNTFKPGYSDFKSTISANDSFVVAYVGRLDPIKGLTVLMRAFQQILKSGKNFRLVLIGPDFGMKSSLLTQAREMGVERKVSVLGPMSPEKLVFAYRGVDVVVLPSYFEMFGMSALEAMACGTPVVGSDTGGLRELIENGKSGFLVPPGNPSLLAANILQLANSKNRLSFGENAVKAARRYDIRTVTSRIEDVFVRISALQ